VSMPSLSPSRLLEPWLWRGRDLAPDRWIRHLTREQQEAVRSAATRWEESDPPRPEKASFSESESATLSPCVTSATSALRHGPGIYVIRGFPVDAVTEAGLGAVLLAFGSLLGVPVPQTRANELVREVSNKGKDYTATTVRGHDTGAALAYHCDRADLVGLLCVRPASEGGRSSVVSAATAHEALRARSPQLLRTLYEGFPHDRRGEQGPSETAWTSLPVFSAGGGEFVARYIRRFVEDAAQHPRAPELDEQQRAALDALDATLDEPGMALEMDLEPGDLQLLNSLVTFHSRTAFVDSVLPGRLLLRVWLAPSWSPRLPASFEPLFGSTEPGAVRGGVLPAW
jgi:alpha-ketoglutarate-dependent taurine dioxygenase